MRFSVITVCLNAGEKLRTTMDSALGQTCRDFEVILKDGGSGDGSVEEWRRKSAEGESAIRDGAIGGEGVVRGGNVEGESAFYGGIVEREAAARGASGHIRVFVEKDKGIYDAMNQAVAHASGDFLVFMNCGDVFADERVLERAEEKIRELEQADADLKKLVLYGDTVNGANGVTIASAPQITGFTCYRNIPCHQSCFYARKLCVEKPYDLRYKIRADYDHFLWCFYRAKAEFVHMGFPVAVYEGGGYSESRENKKRDLEEHRQITEAYMGRGELLKYRTFMALTLAPLRRAAARSGAFSGIYHLLKEKLYKG